MLRLSFAGSLSGIVSLALLAMRIFFILLVPAVFIACTVCYFTGYRSGAKESPLRAEREGQIYYSLGAYRALETTNLSKLHGFIEIELLSCTRDYERRFGVPSGTSSFSKTFSEAKSVANGVEKHLVRVGVAEGAIVSNLQNQIGR